MKKIVVWLQCFLILFILTIFDRYTKEFAVNTFVVPYRINKILSFELVFNRGISWGIFGSGNELLFVSLSFSILLFLLFFVFYIKNRYQHNQSIFAELLVLVGALSNLYDRFYYQGVIDFIVLSFHSWSWPVFNFADLFIVIGIGIMFLRSY